MKIMMSYAGMQYEPPAQILTDAYDAGGLYEKRDLDDLAGLFLSFPEGGERDD
jgi:hypothetical protein